MICSAQFSILSEELLKISSVGLQNLSMSCSMLYPFFGNQNAQMMLSLLKNRHSIDREIVEMLLRSFVTAEHQSQNLNEGEQFILFLTVFGQLEKYNFYPSPVYRSK